ncbi:Antiholin-like protein LrgA [Rhodovastum atsumiense]|uniref:CidA/LrgA family protein n=1 Tax=Rhodovastum atsumiense TaxID=504468 RepID=A0A5M6IPB7_9PROT|nr:CidA/LrgA family protein [Rhodovastum atsumiense]KAA5610110.1 CidA/LrgA family protein [Rhodovastum atsumiense]CAH2601418.1 Antiholin-like protein LrgA [Rhodovastum atsumiense]
MLTALVVLLGCQLAGEVIARAGGIPVPGPVIGFVLLLLGLAVRAWWQPEHKAVEGTPLAAVAAVLLGNFSLMFVPAGVGVIQQGPVLLQYGPVLFVAVIVSTFVTLVVTGVVFMAVSRWLRKGA